MKLPNAQTALVEREKITDYLLNSLHLYGAGKARYFLRFGFRLEAWEVFAQALREHGQQPEVTAKAETPFGPRYEVEGAIRTPDGRNPRIRTVWQVGKGRLAPRLISAYPVEQIP